MPTSLTYLDNGFQTVMGRVTRRWEVGAAAENAAAGIRTLQGSEIERGNGGGS